MSPTFTTALTGLLPLSWRLAEGLGDTVPGLTDGDAETAGKADGVGVGVGEGLGVAAALTVTLKVQVY